MITAPVDDATTAGTAHPSADPAKSTAEVSGSVVCRELFGGGPAVLEAVEECCRLFRGWAASENLPQRFAVELLLREALTNAVAHGCECDSTKCVAWTLRLRRGRGQSQWRTLLIAVRDEGPGFEWSGASGRRAALDACSGRGLEIYRCYANLVRFNRLGNAVFLVKRFDSDSD